MYHEIIMGGVGGQGIMVIGNLLAHAAFMENLNVTYIPIYGVEKRGGRPTAPSSSLPKRLALPSWARRNPASS